MLEFAKTRRNKAIAAVIVVMLLFASAGCSGKVAAKTEEITIVPEGKIIIDGECYDWTGLRALFVSNTELQAVTAVHDDEHLNGGTGIKSVEARNNSVILTGSIEYERKVGGLRRLSRLRLKLEEYHKEVKVLEVRTAGKTLRFILQLIVIPDFLTCLASQEMNQARIEVEKPEAQDSAGQA